MAPASFITGLVVASLLFSGLAAASPTLAGSFRADPYGALEFSTEGELVSGVTVEAGPCHFDAQRRILEGYFQGSVLVGRLTVCQTGPVACQMEQEYPFLGFYNEEDNTLVAHVRLREGCQSPALRAGRLVLVPERREPPAETPASSAPGASSASVVASKRNQRNIDAARQANELGKRLYLRKDYVGAAQQFEISLSHDPGDKNWPAHLGLGSSRLKLGQVKAAIEALEKSRSYNRKDSSILYMLGCAYGQKGDKSKALSYLERAVRAGYPLHEVVEGDPDLTRHLGSEAQFQDLLKKSREKAAPSRGTAGPGTLSP